MLTDTDTNLSYGPEIIGQCNIAHPWSKMDKIKWASYLFLAYSSENISNWLSYKDCNWNEFPRIQWNLKI